LTGEYVDKYTKRGKGYVVLESQACDENGTIYVKQRSTEIMRVPETVELGGGSSKSRSRRVKGEWPTDRRAVFELSQKVVVGTPIEPLKKQIFQDQMSVFSGAGKHHHNIHTDIEMARAAGFEDTLAQGMMEACWLSELMDRFFGTKWLTNGSYSVVFLQPIYAGDQVVCKAVVTGIADQPAGRDYEIEMWIEKEDGKMATAGWANCFASI
jgi:acyl dehydratase